MTPDDRTKKLLDLVKEAIPYFPASDDGDYFKVKLRDALADFEPDPEMVYTMPEFETLRAKNGGCDSKGKYIFVDQGDTLDAIYERAYNSLRESTRVPKPKLGREMWIWNGMAFDTQEAAASAYNFDVIRPKGHKPLFIHVREVLPSPTQDNVVG